MNRRGFTLVEIVIVIGLISLLSALSVVNLVSGSRRVVKTSTRSTLVADIRSQQIKAMTRISPGNNYGIQIDDTSYTLLPDNYQVNLENMALSTTFPNSQIIFLPLSGQISGFINGQNTITLTDSTDGTTAVISFNSYGTAE